MQLDRTLSSPPRYPLFPADRTKPGEHAPVRYGFVLLPGFSNFSLQALLEPLRLASAFSSHKKLDPRLLSLDGKAVMASDGSFTAVDGDLASAPPPDKVVLCGGYEDPGAPDAKLAAWLRQYSRTGKCIGAIESGCITLVRLGLLQGQSCTVHWRFFNSLNEQHPDLNVERHLYELTSSRFTGTGGVAVLDLALALIEREFGEKIATEVSINFNQERRRNGKEPQRLPLSKSARYGDAKLEQALEILQHNLEEDLSKSELAARVNISLRQLERLFRRYMGATPMAYRRELRLWRARDLLFGTAMSITQIAHACGFKATSHFSKCFRDHFGIPPREFRRLNGYGTTAGGISDTSR